MPGELEVTKVNRVGVVDDAERPRFPAPGMPTPIWNWKSREGGSYTSCIVVLVEFVESTAKMMVKKTHKFCRPRSPQENWHDFFFLFLVFRKYYGIKKFKGTTTFMVL